MRPLGGGGGGGAATGAGPAAPHTARLTRSPEPCSRAEARQPEARSTAICFSMLRENSIALPGPGSLAAQDSRTHRSRPTVSSFCAGGVGQPSALSARVRSAIGGGCSARGGVVVVLRRRWGRGAGAVRGARLVLVELKCGFHGRKDLPATGDNGRLCMLKAPLKKAKDCVLHRHFAQLAATLALFKSEKTTRQQLQKIGIADVDAVLLYVDDGGSMLYELPEWWQERGPRILNNICQN